MNPTMEQSSRLDAFLLQTLKKFAERERLKVLRDECNDPIIPGRQGQTYPWSTDGTILGVTFMPPKTEALPWGRWCPKIWNRFRKMGETLGMAVIQDGDSEGCLAFDPQKPDQVLLALKIAKVKRKRQMSPAQCAVVEQLKMFSSNRRAERPSASGIAREGLEGRDAHPFTPES